MSALIVEGETLQDFFRYGSVHFSRGTTTMVRGIIGIAITVWLVPGAQPPRTRYSAKRSNAPAAAGGGGPNLVICEIQGKGRQ